ncbi:nucleotidyltransferase [candidate division WOR-3 bacterium]|nr:nucleotidyltransferase [candidate division WOR-3 bacterium]
MNSLEDTLIRLVGLLKKTDIPYMVIGGLANAVWGEPRSTLDIDITIQASKDDTKKLIEHLKKLCHPRITDSEEFVRKTSVLPMITQEGVRIDIIFAGLPFELEAIKRAVEINIQGTKVGFITPEDLIIHKIVSERQKDWDDVQGIIRR